jgi:predicted transcriptional regulator
MAYADTDENPEEENVLEILSDISQEFYDPLKDKINENILSSDFLSFLILLVAIEKDGDFGFTSKIIARELGINVQCVSQHLKYRLSDTYDLVYEEDGSHDKRKSRWHVKMNEDVRESLAKILWGA